MYFLFNHTN